MSDENFPARSGSAPTTRRRFLRGVGAAGVAAGLGGVASAQPVETFEFDGGIGAWTGIAPSSIEGEQNPTIELEAGRRYRVVWHNIDGFDHNFAILDADGNEAVRTPVVSDRGVTQTVEFTATEEMVEYYCEVHPRTMRGDVDIAGREDEPDVQERRRTVEQGGTIGLEPVADGLTAPVAMEVADEDRDRRFVADQTGQIYVHDADGIRAEPFLDIADRMVELGVTRLNGYDERGLLGLAFHPEFADNGRFYVRYSAPVPEGMDGGDVELDHASVLAEFEATDDFASADPDSERRVMEIPSPQMNHNGGDVAFGPEGHLYFGIGDGGAADDVGRGHVEDWYDENAGGNGQDVTENLLGSVLRIDVDSQDEGQAYAVPDDNPLVGEEGLDEQYAWGFRNPWKLSFNDGELFVADAGQNLYEEVNVVERGGNYGWNVKEGTNCFSTENPSDPDAITDCPSESPRGEPLRDPEIQYRHPKSTTAFIDGSVVVGGYVYDGEAMGDLQGDYVFGNWSGFGVVDPDGEIFVAREPEGDDGDERWTVEELAIAGSDTGKLGRYVMGFGRGQDGELYVLTSRQFKPEGDTGEVFRLVPEGEGADISVESGEETTTDDGEETTTE